MTEYSLVLLETSGIQPYVFGSNHLMQNIGASELVARATTEWVYLDLDGWSSNVTGYDILKGLLLDGPGVREGSDAEVIYSGGGNVLLFFQQPQAARAFIGNITRRALCHAPGLHLVAASQPFDWDQPKSLIAAEQTLRQTVAARKGARPRSRPLPGLAVTAEGVFTGLPAVGLTNEKDVVGELVANRVRARGEEPRLIAAPVAARLRAVGPAEERLRAVLKEVEQRGYDFAYDFDQFGEKGTSSYIAVVHADGNAMGKRFQNLQKDAAGNQDYVNRLRALSRSVLDTATAALQETVDFLLNSAHRNGRFGGVVPTQSTPSGHRLVLPFRPLIFGGDDTTFVCEGRLGLALAEHYLRAYTGTRLADNEPVTARAGVAIVKTHYPFSRAYDLAAGLERTAKRAIPDFSPDGANVLDWHVSTTGVIRSLQETRRREYMNSQLLLRPLHLDGDHWRSWRVFSGMVDRFQNDDAWRSRRNKVLAMREALRAGPDAFGLFLRNYDINPERELPDIPGRKRARRTGWHDSRCVYYDAIEATDFFVDLARQEVPQ